MTFVPLVGSPDVTDPFGRWYVVRQSEILTTTAGLLPTGAGDPFAALDLELGGRSADGPLVLGALDGLACWAVGVAPGTPEPPGHEWRSLFELAAWGTDEWALAGRAIQLVEWWRTSRFCGRCGTPTEPSASDRSMRCPRCQLSAYPRLAPAVIVLVRKGKEILLAQGAGFRGTFSCLAGFVEPGETLEQTVHRELDEEVGIKVGQVRYVASQAWPFPHSLMIGFHADWISGELAADGVEIVEAGWWTADNLPQLPPPLSIARQLIDNWLSSR
jgi:NAD+ diphosphatase